MPRVRKTTRSVTAEVQDKNQRGFGAKNKKVAVDATETIKTRRGRNERTKSVTKGKGPEGSNIKSYKKKEISTAKGGTKRVKEKIRYKKGY